MDKLNRTKSVFKSKVTKLESFAEKELNEETSVAELEVKVRNLRSIAEKIDNLRLEYYDVSDLKKDVTLLEEMEKDMEIIEDRLEKLEVRFKNVINCSNQNNAENDESVKNENEIAIMKPKIPPIVLPEFFGKYEEFSNFKSQFNDLITKNAQLTDSQKLYYLRSSLKGEAKQLETSDDSFKSLFTALCERYENKRLLVDIHVQAILNIERMQHESYKELRSLIDTVNKSLRALKVVNYETNELCEIFLVNIILPKLDKETRKNFELSKSDNEVIKFQELLSFLEKRSSVLENINRGSAIKSNKFQVPFNKHKALVINENQTSKQCCVCKNSHPIFKCEKFLKLTPEERFEIVKNKKLCMLCLRFGHLKVSCRSQYLCFCKKRHNKLLHLNEKIKTKVEEEFAPPVNEVDETDSSKSEVVMSLRAKKSNHLLCTTIIYIHGKGARIPVRCLLDCGANTSILTRRVADALGLKKKRINVQVTGLNNHSNAITQEVETLISNKDKSFVHDVQFLIMPEITSLIPSTDLDITNIEIPKFVELGDKTFYKKGKIDCLIGSNLFFKILKQNTLQVGDELILRDTVFGWVATGSLKESHASKPICCLVNQEENIENNLKTFWDLETLGIKDDPKLKEEDKALEIYNDTVQFKDGRYVVKLPWKRDWRELKDNSEVAKQRLRNLQRKFRENPELYSQYKEIIEDYIKKGIIERVKMPQETEDKPVYYMPHQAVIKQERLTTKLRIVFDASSHQSRQLSLNDCLWPGINLNANLFDLLINFRLYKIAISADIEKAFLQICLADDQKDAVRFLWSDNTQLHVKEFEFDVYRFNRVLFGINASPFLLSATIKFHVQKYRKEYPEAVQMLENWFYVDDLIAGEDKVEDALEVSRKAYYIMEKAGMNLRKWTSNNSELMEQWGKEGFDTRPIDSSISLGSNLTKVLGMAWDTQNDCLLIETKGLIEFISSAKNTKRFLLQAVGKIFDPLGLLTPLTIRVKCLIQDLWERKIPWDERLPPDIEKEWNQWCTELYLLERLKIPRLVLESSKEDKQDILEIHTFSDASKRAYGAAAFIRVVRKDSITVNLIASKSRVAPLNSLTLPRLELLGALIAARLADKVKSIIDLKKPIKNYYWTDSKIVLFWIKGSVKRWKNFVANRVVEIKTLSDPSCWHHCPGKQNPADMLTRGSSFSEFSNNTMWWRGPSFLHSDCDFEETDESCDVPEEHYDKELKTSELNYAVTTDCSSDSKVFMVSELNNSEMLKCLLNCSNNFSKIVRILSFIFRFINNSRFPADKKLGNLKGKELIDAEEFLLKEVQKEAFNEEIKILQRNGDLPSRSKIIPLSPFIDERGLLRVGGRLKNSDIKFESKHPILLPAKHKISELIVEKYHKKYLHLGAQALLYQIRQSYWPINGRNLCRKIVKRCIKCFKECPTINYQKMGDLPRERVNPGFVFHNVGLDLCGPFFIKNKNQRKGPGLKVYVCIFVCLATKALHLEIVSDLTSESLINTLKRFFARRGHSKRLFSDHGSNFIGANREIKRFYHLIKRPDQSLGNFLAEERLEWSFIPPRAPNFGGLWEAGVKAFKFHFKRVIGNEKLTYEELLTVINQIEAMLNSRPLTPLSSDVEDLNVLTPGHFLIGRPITTLPEPSLLEINANRLNLWQRVTRYVQLIWRRWSVNYLNNLQQRTKWKFEKKNIKINDMVIVREENLPVGKWILGRIVKVYPGRDEKIRVADVKTKTGVYRRSVSKLSVLPIET